jgi:flagellar basal body-associated protein FliL
VTCQTWGVLPAQVTVGDPTAARLVLLIVITLVVLGLALIAVAVWLIRSTRVDPPEMAVLELMTTHAYLSADTEERERMIERVLAEMAEADVDSGEANGDSAGTDTASEAAGSADGGEPADSVR